MTGVVPGVPRTSQVRSLGEADVDAVIDLSAHNAVSDFRLVRASNILGKV